MLGPNSKTSKIFNKPKFRNLQENKDGFGVMPSVKVGVALFLVLGNALRGVMLMHVKTLSIIVKDVDWPDLLLVIVMLVL